MMECSSPPEFSASVLGTTSKASPNFLMAYWSRPWTSSANADSLIKREKRKEMVGVGIRMEVKLEVRIEGEA